MWKSTWLYQILCTLSLGEKDKISRQKKIKNAKYIPKNKRLTNHEDNLLVKKAFEWMGNQLAKEYEDGGLKNLPLLEIVETNKFESLSLIPLEEAKEIFINLKKQV